jgi:hypothetical protein
VLRRVRLQNLGGVIADGEAQTGSAGSDGIRSGLAQVRKGVARSQQRIFWEVEALAADVLHILSPFQTAAWRSLFGGEAERGGGQTGKGRQVAVIESLYKC